MSCSICTEKFTKVKRQQVVCDNENCDTPVCRECVISHLLLSEDFQPKCMCCDQPRTFNEIKKLIPVKSKMKLVLEKFANVKFLYEETQLAGTQELAKIQMDLDDADLRYRVISKEYKEMRDELKKLKEEKKNNRYRITELKERSLDPNKHIEINRLTKRNRQELSAEIRDKTLVLEQFQRRKFDRAYDERSRCQRRLHIGFRSLGGRKESSGYKFIKECSHQGCVGRLKHDWTCGLCEKETCSKCEQEKEDGHQCDKDIVKSINELRKESKPCPNCGTGISKISGCDQMFCVKCETSFSWNTGRIQVGLVHNPEFFRMRREGRLRRDRLGLGDVENNRNVLPGGRNDFVLIDTTDLFGENHLVFCDALCRYVNRKVYGNSGRFRFDLFFQELFRMCIHILESEIRVNVEHKIKRSMAELRIKFLTKKDTKEQWKSKHVAVVKREFYHIAWLEIMQEIVDYSRDFIRKSFRIFDNDELTDKEVATQRARDNQDVYWNFIEQKNKEIVDLRKSFGYTKGKVTFERKNYFNGDFARVACYSSRTSGF